MEDHHEQWKSFHPPITKPPTIRKPPAPRGKTGVLGVSTHKVGYKASITINRREHLLYVGPSFEAACSARKHAEQTMQRNIQPKHDAMPPGVNVVYSTNGVPRYRATGIDKVLYAGRSLTMAVEARKKWEQQQLIVKPYLMVNRQLGYRIHGKNKSGVRGVCQKKDGLYYAYGTSKGVSRNLYRGKSLQRAINARNKWEKNLISHKNVLK